MTSISEEKVGRKYCTYGTLKKDTKIVVGRVKGKNHAQGRGVNKRTILKCI
jgi:hypothetical protein